MASGRGWFDSSRWLRQTIQFKNPPGAWRIIQKLQERDIVFPHDEYTPSDFYSESTCVFVCEEIPGSASQAIMKVRMQIPNSVDNASSSQTFIQPPERDICDRTALEIQALQALTSAGCLYTPKYITSKHTNQNSDGCVPGGFLDYIVMEKVEGITVSECFCDLQPEEQQELRDAFKLSYMKCQILGFVPLDANPSNLIWNKQKGICYIIDWETWGRKAYPWNDKQYHRWCLLSFM